MSAPWPQTHGFSIRSLSNPYARMMNTSGITFKDHAGSMVRSHPLACISPPSPISTYPLETPAFSITSSNNKIPRGKTQDLCHAALTFASETLKPNGHFVCKFYQGAEDKAFETLLRKMFAKVHREKPESSRSVRSFLFFPFLSFLSFPSPICSPKYL